MSRKSKNIYLVGIGMVGLGICMRLLGFVKQMVVAYYFGATEKTDVYFVANNFVNSVSAIAISSFSVAFLGEYTNVRIKKGIQEGNKLYSAVMEIMFVISCALAVVICVLSPWLGKILAPAFSREQSGQLIRYLCILSGIFVINGLEMVWTGVLKSHENYYIVETKSFLWSLCTIAACIFFSDTYGVGSLAGAQYIACLAYILILCFYAKKHVRFQVVGSFHDKHVRKILSLVPALVIGNSIVETSYIIDRSVVTFLGEGAVSSLSYSQVLDMFVTSIVVSGICTIIFARMAKLSAEHKKKDAARLMKNSISIMVFLLVPVSVVMFCESVNITGLVYYRGDFSAEMVGLTAAALQGYTIRYPFVAVRDILVQGMYAQQDTKTPMANAAISTVINVIVSVAGVKYMGIIAISLGTTTAAVIGALLNIKAYKESTGFQFGFMKSICGKSVLAVIFCLAGLYIKDRYITVQVQIADMALSAVLVFGIYYMVLLLLREKELWYLLQSAVQKVRKGHAG